MLFPACVSKGRFRISLLTLAVCFCSLWFPAPSFGQQLAPQTPVVSGGETAKPDINKDKDDKDKTKLMGTRPEESPVVLQQLNSAIEQLTARISPAVVQILVTGYGSSGREQPRSNGAHNPRECDRFRSNRGSGRLHHDQCSRGRGGAAHPRGPPHAFGGFSRPDSPVGKQRVVEARLIGMHKETDLALLKIDQTGLPTLSLGSRPPVHQGQLVFALGSPEGLENSVTMGIVSSVARQADPNRPMVYIQTDAPINPGIAAARWLTPKAT